MVKRIVMKKFFLIASFCLILSSCKKWDEEKLPDLVAIQLFSANGIAPGNSIQEVIEIDNTGEGATGGQIYFTITNFPASSGLTVTLNNNPSITIGTDTYFISNADWDVVFTPSEITFTSKPGVAIGPGFANFIGLTISRGLAPNQGADDTVTQTILIQGGTGGGETPDTNNTASATINKLKVPDLAASQFFSTLQIAAGGTIEELVQIRNLGSGPTTAPIKFTVTNYDAAVGLIVSSNNNPTVTIGIDTYTLTNATDWDVTVSATALTFTSKTGVVIAPGASKLVGITITRAAPPNQGANENITHTVTITAGTGGGESPSTNNTVFNRLVKI